MRKKLTRDNWSHIVKVGGFVAASGAVAAVIQWIPNVDMGAGGDMVAMGLLNLAAVALKEYLKNE